jgi:integrase
MALTVKAIEHLKPGDGYSKRYRDSKGLYLQVAPAKDGRVTRSWIFRFAVGGKARHAGLGSYPEISLARARELAGAWRAKLQGPDPVDPIAERRQKLLAIAQAIEQEHKDRQRTFGAAAEGWLKTREKKWSNDAYRRQVDRLLTSTCESIWAKPVKDIDEDDVRRVLEPVWKNTPTTASRLRMYIEGVLAKAKALRWRTGENPARWKENLEHSFVTPSKNDVDHVPALPIDDAPEFAAKLRARDDVAAKALELLLLTAVRLADVRQARWRDFDLMAQCWNIPKMSKTKMPFRVPLSDRAVALLQGIPHRTGNGHVFAGRREGKPIGASEFGRIMQPLYPGYPPRGLRSTFRDWAAERTSHPNHVVEMALGHIIADKVEAAYRRGDLFAKRAALMRDWSRFCARPPSVKANVVQLHKSHAQ